MTSIPKISDERLEELMKQMQPVVRFARLYNEHGTKELQREKRGDLYYIRPVHPRNQTFVFDPKPTKRAYGLKPFKTIETYHMTGGFFHKPSIAEVIAQIPEDCLERVVAFEERSRGFDGESRCYTVADTTLYESRRKP